MKMQTLSAMVFGVLAAILILAAAALAQDAEIPVEAPDADLSISAPDSEAEAPADTPYESDSSSVDESAEEPATSE